jgi:hypothetical protein
MFEVRGAAIGEEEKLVGELWKAKLETPLIVVEVEVAVQVVAPVVVVGSLVFEAQRGLAPLDAGRKNRATTHHLPQTCRRNQIS